ncbi:family 16 glycoside hydrolase [Marinoscillum luteum]|uniref:Family 16 glycoside hydrolase n=1 Tax=Marinoscillum luteum TaxID=861051 RepID=A0ABW7N3C4_9BACT
MKKLIYFSLLIGAMSACQERKEIERPREAWVFRSVLDLKPRMVTAALSEDVWVAYDARTASLYKAWKGGVNFDGAVYTTVHGPQPTSKGYAYYTDEKEDVEWVLKKGDEILIPKVQYKGHRFVDGQVVFTYELSTDDNKITVEETPEAIRRGSQSGLSRKFKVSNAGDYQVVLNTTISSLVSERDFNTNGCFEVISKSNQEYPEGNVVSVVGVLTLSQGEPTELRAFYHEGFDKGLPVATEESDEASGVAAGAQLIERSDCKSCHNEQVKTVGPAYISVARKYSDGEESVKMLSGKVIKGGSGVWGEAMMTPHAGLSEEDAAEMIRYILSLDDNDEDSDGGAWHLGEKTVPVKFQDEVNISSESPGVAAYLYLYSGDQPNFNTLKKEALPIGGAIVPQIHVRDESDFGERTQRIAVLFKGNLRIEKTASYSLRLVSDDGSRLFVDNKIAIDHGGFHGPTPKDGEVYLTAGDHPFEIQYFQASGGGAVSFQWFNKDAGKFEVIPQSMLFVSPSDYLETKEYISDEVLVKSIPGDGRWLAGVHPAFDIFQARPDDFQPRVGGIDFLSEDEMLVCTWDSLGPVYLVKNFRSTNPEEITVQRIATGLAEPLGIKVVDGEIYVLQKQELTKLIDNDKDGLIDEYQTIADDWSVSANFHEFSFGLVYKDGYFYGALATDILPGGASAQPQPKDRGKIIKIAKETGAVEFIASGLRTPNGIGIGVDGEIFVADNQGDWLPASKINHVREGAWYGSRSVDPEGTEGWVQDEPVVWLPQDEIGNSPSTPLAIDKGPYTGQMIHCEVTHGGIKRVAVEKVDGIYQGAVFRFSQGIEAGVNRLAWAPDGSLIAGGIGVSGNWGQTGKLNYGLQRLVYNGNSAFEMLKVSARSNGFEIEFTEPIKVGQNISVEDFLIEQFYFKPTAEYGGPKLDVTEMKPKNFYLSTDRKKVFFELEGLQEKHVVYFRIKRPFVSELDHELWTTEAWYTLTNIPEGLPGFTNDYKVTHNVLSEAEKAQGWKLLFDGKTTQGLRNYKVETLGKKWQAVNGTLHFSGKGSGAGWQAEDGGDIIITDKPYKNYEFQIDWKMSDGGNSGIIYNVVEDDQYDYVWHTGPEYQLLDNLKHPDGQIEKHRSGDLYDMIKTKFVTVNPTGEWNRTRIKVNNGHVEHWLNGYKVVEFDFWTPEWDALVAGSKFSEMKAFGTGKEGHISLQDHGDKVWFRNIKIREL